MGLIHCSEMIEGENTTLVALFTQCPGDALQTGTGKINLARKFKCTTAARVQRLLYGIYIVCCCIFTFNHLRAMNQTRLFYR